MGGTETLVNLVVGALGCDDTAHRTSYNYIDCSLLLPSIDCMLDWTAVPLGSTSVTSSVSQ